MILAEIWQQDAYNIPAGKEQERGKEKEQEQEKEQEKEQEEEQEQRGFVLDVDDEHTGPPS